MIFHHKIKNLKECENCYKEALNYKKQINDILGNAQVNGLLGSLFLEYVTICHILILELELT